MFQRVIEIDPDFGGGYAGRGFSYTITVLFLKTSKPGIELENGINLALKAIEVDPELGMEDEARAIIRNLNRSNPGFPVEGWLEKWHESNGGSSRVIENLYRLGLPRKNNPGVH